MIVEKSPTLRQVLAKLLFFYCMNSNNQGYTALFFVAEKKPKRLIPIALKR